MFAGTRRATPWRAGRSAIGCASSWRGGGEFTEHYERDDLSKADSYADDVAILLAGRLATDIPMQMARYREPFDTAEASQAPLLDAALESLPPYDRGFVAYHFCDTRPHPSDADKVDAIATQFARDELHLFIESCTARAADLVWSNATAVALVAAELSRRPALDPMACRPRDHL